MTKTNAATPVITLASCTYQRFLSAHHADDQHVLNLHFPACQVMPGTRTWLAGPSGSGKSTLLQVIAGLLPAPQGIVQVNGLDPHTLTPTQRTLWRGQTLGYLPQNPLLIDTLSVMDNLQAAAWAALHPWDAAHANAILQQLNIAPLARRQASQLSRGQAQRVALARALLLQHTLLLVDEPTANLDDHATAEVLALLTHISDAGITVVMASHDQRVQHWALHHIAMPSKVNHAS